MYIDLFIIVIALWAAFSGWRNGCLKEIVSTIGFLLGLLVAAMFYEQLGDYLAIEGTEVNMVTSILAFFILWIIVPIALGLAASILTKALDSMCLGFPNKLLGAAVSLVKYAVLVSCVLNMMSVLNIMDKEKAAESRLFAPAKALLTMCFNHPAVTEQLDNLSLPDTLWVDFENDSTSDGN